MAMNLPRTWLPLSCSILALAAPQSLLANADMATNSDDAAEAAADDGENMITVTADHTPTDVDDVAVTVTVIDQQQIADELATDIRDLVRFEPGVTVRRLPARFSAAGSSGGRAGNEGFNIRGIGGNRVLIQVDGIRSPQGFAFGGQSVGRDNATDIGLIKSVEILRGPTSALYGSDGLAGAVSFITSDPADFITEGNDFGGFARAQFSSVDDEFAETAAIAGRWGNFSTMLAYARRDFSELDNKGEVDGEGSARTIPNPQDGQSDAWLGKLLWNSGDHQIRLTGEYLQRHVSSNILSHRGPVSFFGPTPVWTVDSMTADDRSKRGRGSFDYIYDAGVGGGKGGLIEYARFAAYWQDGRDRQFSDEKRTDGSRPAPDRERLNLFNNRVIGANAEIRTGFNSGNVAHQLSLGGEVSKTRQQGIRDGTIPPAGEIYPTAAFPETEFTLGGLFFGDRITLADGALILYPGVRYDFFNLEPSDDPLLPSFKPSGQSGSRLSPKLGAVAKLGGIRLFANYARGFRAPTPGQVNNFFANLNSNYSTVPNPDLRPENSKSFEAGVRYVADDFGLTLTGYTADYDDFIGRHLVSGNYTPADPAVFQFINIDRVEVKGIEAKAHYHAANGLRSRFAIAYADGTTFTPDQPPKSLGTIDPLNAIFGIGYRDPDGAFGGEITASYSARKAADETIGVCRGECFRPQSSTILDATAFVRISDQLKLRAGIFNLTDQKYILWSTVGGQDVKPAGTGAFDPYTHPGRNISVSLSASF